MKLKNKESKKDIYSMSQEERKALWAKNDKEYSFPKTLEYTMEELIDDYIADQKHKYGVDSYYEDEEDVVWYDQKTLEDSQKVYSVIIQKRRKKNENL